MNRIKARFESVDAADMEDFVARRLQWDRDVLWSEHGDEREERAPWLAYVVKSTDKSTQEPQPQDVGSLPMLNVSLLSGYLRLAITSFSVRANASAFEGRLEALEQKLGAFSERFEQIARSDADASAATLRLAEAKRHSGLIREIFEGAFGFALESITFSPSLEESSFVVALLDASMAPRHLVSKARTGGARRRFYELLIERMPRDVFTAMEFEFILSAQ